jgi:geranylgeranyl diphosphate synthase type I
MTKAATALGNSPASFAEQLARYKLLIDADIITYSHHIAATTRDQYGDYVGDVIDVFFDVLGRGGKRLRGALAMVGYEMCGGQDQQMIVRAATALEMFNAYILMIDDIQDRSSLRRGKATAHEMLADYHRSHQLKGDAAHSGVSLTLNAAFAGAHAAQILLAGLNVDAELRMKVIAIVNQAMLITSHGQTYDLMNELKGQANAADIDHVLEWKTAYYTVLNPLCVGMVLAGAGCEDTDAIRDYGLHTGKAFQITDDIIGIFGNEAETGKSVMDDMREGKQTLLTAYAFAHLSDDGAAFLEAMLGNAQLTPKEFLRCQQLMESCGARQHAQDMAGTHIADAIESLNSHAGRWSSEHVTFLSQLATSLVQRKK